MQILCWLLMSAGVWNFAVHQQDGVIMDGHPQAQKDAFIGMVHGYGQAKAALLIQDMWNLTEQITQQILTPIFADADGILYVKQVPLKWKSTLTHQNYLMMS